MGWTSHTDLSFTGWEDNLTPYVCRTNETSTSRDGLFVGSLLNFCQSVCAGNMLALSIWQAYYTYGCEESALSRHGKAWTCGHNG